MRKFLIATAGTVALTSSSYAQDIAITVNPIGLIFGLANVGAEYLGLPSRNVSVR